MTQNSSWRCTCRQYFNTNLNATYDKCNRFKPRFEYSIWTHSTSVTTDIAVFRVTWIDELMSTIIMISLLSQLICLLTINFVRCSDGNFLITRRFRRITHTRRYRVTFWFLRFTWIRSRKITNSPNAVCKATSLWY